ncbi:MAG: hypothetical protein RIR33_1890 [Pseudomonadota bacterium]|jgi:hypothetical protein
MSDGGSPYIEPARRGERGYILASVIGVLLAISLVAAALVTASGEAASRLRRAEDAAKREAVLEAAILVLTSQLAMDPRRRALDLEAASTLEALGQTVRFKIAWETNKLEINRADPEAVARRLEVAGAPAELRAAVQTRLAAARSSNTPIGLLAGIAPGIAGEDCLASVLTVFGGQENFDPERLGDPDSVGEKVPIGRPAVGSRMAIDVAVAGREADGLSVVMLLTGDSATPWQVMDWRPSSVLGKEACDETQS